MSDTNSPIETHSEKGLDEGPHESMLEYTCGFFHWGVIRYMLILMLVGVTTGYAGGMTGPWIDLMDYTEECSVYTEAGACEKVMNQDCIWDSTTSKCGWRAGTCSQFTTSAECVSKDYMDCTWSANTCSNKVGYSSLYSGIFGCVPMVMQIILGLFVGDFLAFLHHRNIFMLSGFLLILGSVMQHIGVATSEFWVSTMGRFCLGFAYVFMTVPGMVYVNQNAPPRYKQVLVSFYAVVNNFGQFVPSAIGGALGLTLDFSKEGQLSLHLQLNCMFCTILSVAFTLMGYFIEESPYWATEASTDDEEEEKPENLELENVDEVDEKELLQKVDDMERAKGINVATYSWWSMAGRLLVGICVAGVVQLTGISAFGNYAPMIATNLNINGLVGSILIQAWNTISASMCLVILGITKNLRLVMLSGTMIAAVACLVMGVLIYPGVVPNEKARNGVSIAAVAVYILAFQSCIAGAFYPLAQEMFPLSFRPRGASFMTMFLMLFSFLISVFFPIALSGLSGDQSHDKGLSIIMLFFSVIGFIGFVVIFLFLAPWTAADEKRVRLAMKAENHDEPLQSHE